MASSNIYFSILLLTVEFLCRNTAQPVSHPTAILGLGLQAGYNLGQYSLVSNQSTANDAVYEGEDVEHQAAYSKLQGTNFNAALSPYLTLPQFKKGED